MLSSRGAFSSNWLLLACLLLALSLPVIGQESIVDELIPSPPLFSVIAPRNGDTVSTDVVFIIKPLSSISRATIELVNAPASFKSELSEDNSYTASWSSFAVENGEYTFTFEACDDVACETQDIRVTVKNKLRDDPSSETPASETPSPVDPSVPSDPSSETPSSNNSSSDTRDPPSTPEPPSPKTFEVSPSNYAGAFMLTNDRFKHSSSGGSFNLEEASYFASATFFQPDFSITLDNVFLDSKNVLFFLEEKVLDSFAVGPDTHDVLTSLSLTIPYSFDSATIHPPLSSDANTFACLDWSFDSKSCNSDWIIFPASSDSIDYTSTSIVVGTSVIRPSSVEPPSSLPLYSIYSSNLPTTWSLILPSSDNAPFSDSGPRDVPLGKYDVDIQFSSSDILSASLSSVVVDKNAIILDVSPVPSPISFTYRNVPFRSSRAQVISFGLNYSAASLTFSYSSSRELLFSCSSWDSSSFSCTEPFRPLSLVGGHFEYVPSAPHSLVVYASPFSDKNGVIISDINVFDLNVSDVNVPDVNWNSFDVPLVDVNSQDPRLVEALQWLRQVHTNKDFFSVNPKDDTLSALQRFNAFEVSLECARPYPPLFPSLTPSRVPVSDGVSAESDAVVSDSDAVSAADVPSERGDIITDLANIISGKPPVFTGEYRIALSPYSPLNEDFYHNDWEADLPSMRVWQRSGSTLSCDNISLLNQFDDTTPPPDTPKKVFLNRDKSLKQTITLENTSSTPLVRIVNLRMTLPPVRISTEHAAWVPSSRYALVPTTLTYAHVVDSSGVLNPLEAPSEDANEPLISIPIWQNTYLDFSDANGNVLARYDFQDYAIAGFDPHVLVHRLNDASVVDTLLRVTVPANSSVVLDPTFLLSDSANFATRWNGGAASDRIGTTVITQGALSVTVDTAAIKLVNIDNNSYSNDLLISAPRADSNGKADSGAIYLIKDIDKKPGIFDLLNLDNFDVRWTGSQTNTNIGRLDGGYGVQVHNLDGNAYANDLLIASAFVDVPVANAGAVYMILDVDKKLGSLDFNVLTSFDARFTGTVATDELGFTSTSGTGVQVVNFDNGASSNDLLLTCVLCNLNGRTDNGAVYLIQDVNAKRGIFDLNRTAGAYYNAYAGSMASDTLGSLQTSDQGVFLVDLDNNGYTNDLIIGASLADMNKAGTGSIYVIKDVDTKPGYFDLNKVFNFDAVWYGVIASDGLGGTTSSGHGIILANLDNNAYANDFILSAPLADSGGTNRGAIYMVLDADKKSGLLPISNPAAYNARWVGATNTDEIGLNRGSGQAVQVVNMDGNANANDLVITSYLHNSIAPATARTDNGAVYIIRDVNRVTGNIVLNNTTTNYSYAIYGSVASDFLGDLNFTNDTNSVQFYDLDGNGYANDLIIGGNLINSSKADTGAVYLIRDLNARNPGNYDLNTASNFTARWAENTVTAKLGFTQDSGEGIKIRNIDGNTYANDLFLIAPLADVAGRTNNGAVTLIRDIHQKSGIFDLNTIGSYDARWYGGASSNQLGDTNYSGESVRSVNLDNNSYSNDLIFIIPNSDGPAVNSGSVVLSLDIDSLPPNSFLDTNNESTYYRKYWGAATYNQIGTTFQSGEGAQAGDFDNNGYTNDLIIRSVVADVNSKLDTGVIYLLKDVVVSYSAPSFVSPDVNVWKIEGYDDAGDFPVFNYYFDSNLTLDFNVFDSDTNSLLFDLNYSSSASPFTGTVILNDVNLSSLPSSGPWNCADTDFSDVTRCSFDWDISGVADGNYFFHATVVDSSNLFDQNTSDNNAGILNVPAASYDVNGYVTVHSARSETDITVLNGAGFTTILTIPSDRIVADRNYLVFTSAVLTGNNNAAQVDSIVAHGSTKFATLEEIQELPAAADSTWVYNSFILWKPTVSESVTYQIDCVGAAGDCVVKNSSMLVIDLNALVPSFDYFYDENLTAIPTASDIFENNPGASFRFRGDGKSDYLVFGNGQVIINSTGNAFAEMDLNDGASQLTYVQRDAEDVGDVSLLSLMHVLETPPTTNKTYKLQFSGANVHDVNSSRIFILRLNALANSDSNIVDEAFDISNVLTTRATLDMTLGKDSNVISFHGLSAHHGLGTVGSAQYDFFSYVDDVNYFSSDGNLFRSWAAITDPFGSDYQFHIAGITTPITSAASHSYSTRVISETTNPAVDAHTDARAGVVALSHRLSGDLNVVMFEPWADGSSFSSGVNFNVSGRVLCEDFNCGLVSTTLQYCAGTGCTNYYDINSVSGSPLELVSGSNPDTNSDLNVTQTSDANWVIKGNVSDTYELRLYADGTTSEPQVTNTNSRTIDITSVAADYTFVLYLPSDGCTLGKGNLSCPAEPCACHRGWIEATDLNGPTDNNQIAPDGQSAPVPFFVFDNQSSTSSDLNILLDLNQALSSTLRLKASLTSFGYQAGCSGNTVTGCLLLSTTAQNVGKATYSAGTQDLNVWFWGDFVAADIGRIDVNVDSNSVSPT